MKDNYCDYSAVIKKEPPIYDFCLYTPTFAFETTDDDGWIDTRFYMQTQQFKNHVPKEMSPMNLQRLEEFFKQSVGENGLVVEVGVWRQPNSPDKTSTQLFLELKSDTTDYLGIDLEDRPHVQGYKPRTSVLKMDSGNTEAISNIIRGLYNKPIDFLFIDGLHSVEQVKKELAFIPLVKKGGVIAFHDISFHAGPNVWMEAFDPAKFTIHKFRADDDWGVGVLVKNF